MCAMNECGVDTQRLSIPSTTVAIRKAIALYQSRSVEDVQAAQAQYCGLKTNATVLTTYFTVNATGESECRKRSAVRAVWVFFTSHSSIRLWRIIRGTPTFGPKQSWIYSSTATICPTNSSTSHPFETTTMKMGLLSARDSLLLTFFDNLHGQLILRVLLYWKSVFFSLLDFHSSSMYLFTQQEWSVAHRVLHVGVPAFQFGLCVCPCWDICWLYVSSFFPTICATVAVDLRSTWVFWFSDSFSNTSSTMILHHCQILLLWRGPISSTGFSTTRSCTKAPVS